MDNFDKVFAGKGVRASVRRKLEDGTSRSARLEGAVPAGLTLTDFAEAAMKGTTLGRRCVDRGASLSMSISGITGAAAKSAVLAMGNPADVPPVTARRGRNVEASANGVHTTDSAAS